MPRRSTKTEVKEVSNEALEKIKLIEAVAIKEQEALIPIPKDSKTLLELIRLEIDKNDELEHEKRKRDLRIRYVGRLFWLVVVWLLCVLFFVALAGVKFWGFTLSDSVLIALITSTTATVIGLFIYVAKWLYQSESSSIKKDSKT